MIPVQMRNQNQVNRGGIHPIVSWPLATWPRSRSENSDPRSGPECTSGGVRRSRLRRRLPETGFHRTHGCPPPQRQKSKGLCHRGHNAAKPQPKKITPSRPSPSRGGLPCGVWKVTPQGKGGGAFCLTKFKDFANSSTEATEISRPNFKTNTKDRENRLYYRYGQKILNRSSSRASGLLSPF